MMICGCLVIDPPIIKSNGIWAAIMLSIIDFGSGMTQVLLSYFKEKRTILLYQSQPWIRPTDINVMGLINPNCYPVHNFRSVFYHA